MSRRVFCSFHHQPNHSRAAMVSYIGTVEGSKPATDNGWEAVKRGDGWTTRW